MVNFRYLRSRLKDVLTQHVTNPIVKLFLEEPDIDFLRNHQCLISICPTGSVKGQYQVEFNQKAIQALCNY